MWRLFLIFIGGGAGSVLRYWVQGWGQRCIGAPFPLGTLIVNVSGCLMIGFLAGWSLGDRPMQENYRYAVLVGFLGGFTTFSAFGAETMHLAAERQYLWAGLNVMFSVSLGLLAVWAGRQVA